MPIRRWLSRASLVGAALLLVLALVAPAFVQAQDDPDAGRPPIFQASGFTVGMEGFVNTVPEQTVPEIVRVDSPLGDSVFASGLKSKARAASVWPGLLAAHGGSLLCTAGFPCGEFAALPTGFPPTYPMAAEAEYPTRVDSQATTNGQSGGGGPLTFDGHIVTAHAGRDFVSTRAVTEGLEFFPVPGGAGSFPSLPGSEPGEEPSTALFAAGSMTSTTRHEFQGDVLVGFSESRLTKVSLFAGIVKIDKIVARATTRSNGDDVVQANPQILVEGMTVGGVPTDVKNGRIRFAGGPCTPALPEIGQVCADDQGVLKGISNGVLGLSNGSVRMVGTSAEADEGRADADATAILVSFELDASGFPGGQGIVGDLVLGLAASSSLVADLDSDVVIDDFGGDFGGGFVPGTPGVTNPGFSTEEVVEVAGAGASNGPVSDVPLGGVTAAPQATQGRFLPFEFLSGFAADRMKLLYGAWTLGLVGLALASRLEPFRLSPRR